MAGLILVLAGFLYVLKVNGLVIPSFLWVIILLVYSAAVYRNFQKQKQAKIDRLFGYR